MAPFALLLGIGPLVRWGRDRPRKLKTLLLIAFVTTLVLSLLLPWLLEDRIAAMTVVGWRWRAGYSYWRCPKRSCVFPVGQS